ncbi:hypothetical protein HUT19_41125 [Streptomyces sp. NA02950]|uniref:hypothetical protein n=1 Tax=Streptomyces sp. NA02950 TaxID=2742137 RepID=UPI001591178F|nr:hypothetical protein [Streptomyces sp. NA02950]QKV90382.1 hypothetical protein HUT19_00095 [Streptomyces sp. NA02950]QKV97285.1 hypothetical protein HUT19_41125 [Streptomyces sp. NA02950]
MARSFSRVSRFSEGAAYKLRKLHSFREKGIEGHSFGVCAFPQGQGQLTDEEYAQYLAAADGKHDTYMRHGAPFAPGDLVYEVIVNGTVVAWLPYDGVLRSPDREFPDPLMNEARDFARRHLGVDQETQQSLADERGDIERMSASGFVSVIFEHLERAERGSKFNDFPTDIPVRVYDARRHQEAKEKAAATGRPIQSWPNPTVEYREQQRREWALEAAHYLAAFRDRFPAEYVMWTTLRHHDAHRKGKKLKLPELKPYDRIGIRDYRGMTPVIVLKTEMWHSKLFASLRSEDEERDHQRITPQSFIPEAELLPETRELFKPVWERLARAEPSSEEVAE